jgi:hypothetical protein
MCNIIMCNLFLSGENFPKIVNFKQLKNDVIFEDFNYQKVFFSKKVKVTRFLYMILSK